MAAKQTSNALLKLNQFAKDLNMKTKDVASVLEKQGVTAQTQKLLEPAEFDVLFETLTRENQITNIEDYLDGVTYIPSAKKTAGVEKPAEQKPAGTEVVEEKGVKGQAAGQKKENAESASAVEKKAEAPAAEKGKKEEPVAAKPASNADIDKKAEVSAQKTEVASKPQTAQKPASDAKTSSAPRADRPAAQGGAQPRTQGGAGYQPRQGGYVPKTEGGRPQQQGLYASRTEGGRPQQGGFTPRTEGGRSQQGGFTPRTEGGRPQQGGFTPRAEGGRPQQGAYGQRPQGDRFANPFGGQQRGPQQRPQGQRNDRFGSGQFRDKDDHVQNAPREKFKPQPIVRSQTVKGDESPKQRGATRVVDMRAGTVDLSKYDERLDTFVPDSMGDVRGGNQKVKKQNTSAGRMGAGGMSGGKSNKFKGKKSTQPVTKAPTSVTLPEEIVVSDLASRLKVTSGEIVKRLMMLGMMVTVNQTVDYDTAAILADEMGISATKEVVVTIEERLFEEEEDSEENLVSRAPVVCVMGHVDHGKTSILDAIRHTRVTTGEAGGITQHIGAYRVKVNGQDITFLDTPGHEAFTAMRARGAQATDIAILVVAADDGIMPQTIEAINHAKAAGIDIIVAINKMDKPTANPDQVKQELTKYDLVPEEWGGDVICVPVSALTGMGINDLLENVLLVAEVKELKANPNRRAKGIIIEAKLDKGRGPVATVLVQNGTLRNGDIVIAGTSVGRVRAMTDDKGRNVKEAKPSVPVEIIGLAEVPSAGDEFNAVEDERMARMLADQRREQAKEEVFKANARANLNDLFAQISEGVKELNIIVKADVGGSAEAVKQSLEKISNEEVKVRVIHAAAGGIREGDVMLAAASNAIVVGFNVRPDKGALESAERQNVEIRTYRVIYDCINEITDAMKGMLAPKYRENLLGHAEVRQTIHVPNVGTIAGSYIQDGKIVRSAMIRVVRDGIVIFEDRISSLRRFKDDVREVAQGYECGVGLERFNDIKVGDVLEAYVMEEIER
ncbi:MAG: translation initiation factor IF-2 [Clostridia bacterium]|nr:translation initiation factor IF-2 [Clostridia bacterium]